MNIRGFVFLFNRLPNTRHERRGLRIQDRVLSTRHKRRVLRIQIIVRYQTPTASDTDIPVQYQAPIASDMHPILHKRFELPSRNLRRRQGKDARYGLERLGYDEATAEFYEAYDENATPDNPKFSKEKFCIGLNLTAMEVLILRRRAISSSSTMICTKKTSRRKANQKWIWFV